MIVIFLQNPWSPVYARRGTWPRESWLRALHASRSGQRLRVLTDGISEEIHYDNTTPKVGPEPGSRMPPDRKHVLQVILERDPRVIVACGVQAEKAVSSLWGGPILIIPHPAFRLVTNELLKRANEILQEGEYRGRTVLRQRRGCFREENL